MNAKRKEHGEAAQRRPGPAVFITDGWPSNNLPIPLHRTINLPQILAGHIDGELTT
ncbi:hypothetical protein L520_1910 [Bordetella bronchiseptica MBORD681]|nr:hypothetical protein L520_1910 [Bordetella bronchiseptica MBORD681]KDD04719.1 hypothetical protein L521_2273 [Bordetella bronchiseptica MBORD698]